MAIYHGSRGEGGVLGKHPGQDRGGAGAEGGEGAGERDTTNIESHPVTHIVSSHKHRNIGGGSVLTTVYCSAITEKARTVLYSRKVQYPGNSF